jgi:ABC-2 type transport system ATP-binding protein
VKIVAGILEASSGETYVLGQTMPKLNLMNKIGYMAQSDALYASLTAAENLHFFGTVYGMKKPK